MTKHRLRLLGATEVTTTTAAGTDVVLAHPKRVALLAVLALEGEGGPVQRDTVIALLWPESEERRARNALSQSLHHLRRTLGSGVLLSETGDLVRLDSSLLSCDAVDFLAAVQEGDLERAFELYRGELLPGFHLANAGAFERWLSGVRTRLEQAHAEITTALIERHETEGRTSDAVAVASRALAVRPGDERSTRRLMSLLWEDGDRLAALRVYERFASFMAAEFESEPTTETRNLADLIRGGVEAESGRTHRAEKSPRPEPPGFREEVRSNRSGRPNRRATQTPHLGARWLRVAAGVAVLAAITAYAALSWPRQPVPADDPVTVTVLPFEVRGPEAADYLAESMSLLLASRLDGTGGVRAVDPRTLLAYTRDTAADGPAAADRFGASHHIRGDVFATDHQYEISAALFSGDDAEPLTSARATGPPDSLISLVDQVAASLLASEPLQQGSRIAELGPTGTQDLEALKFYLEGDRLIRAGRYSAAVEELQRAVARDSAFAFAHYRLALAANWADDVPTSMQAVLAAQNNSDALDRRPRQLVEALASYLAGDYRAAEAQYREAVSSDPNQLEAWYMLGESIFHGGPARGRPLAEARPMFERVLDFDPNSSEARIHLIRIAALEGDRRELSTLTDQLVALNPRSVNSLEARALVAFSGRDRAEHDRVIGELRSAPDVVVALTAIGIAAFLDDLPAARRVTALLAERPSGTYERWSEVMTVRLALAQGRFREAKSLMADLDPRDRSNAVMMAVGWVVSTGLTYGVDESFRELVDREASVSFASHRGALAHGLLDVVNGDRARLTSVLAELNAIEEPRYAAELLGWDAWYAQRPAEALAHLRSIDPESGEDPVFGPAQSGRFLYGMAMAQGERPERANPWLSSFGDHTGYDIFYVAPAVRVLADVYASTGDREGARRMRTRLANLWTDADPEVAALLAHE